MGASSEPCATAASGRGIAAARRVAPGPAGSRRTRRRRSGPHRTGGPRRRPPAPPGRAARDHQCDAVVAGRLHAGAGESVADLVGFTGGVAVATWSGSPRRGCASRWAPRRIPLRLGGSAPRRRARRRPPKVDRPLVGQRRGQLGQAVGVEERGVGGAVEEGRMPQHIHQQVAVGAHAVDAGAGQRVGEHPGGLTTGRRVRDDLGDHRVVEHDTTEPSTMPVSRRTFAGTSKRCTVPACGCQPLAGSSAYSRASIEYPRDGGGPGRGGRRRRPAAAARRGPGRWSPRTFQRAVRKDPGPNALRAANCTNSCRSPRWNIIMPEAAE